MTQSKHSSSNFCNVLRQSPRINLYVSCNEEGCIFSILGKVNKLPKYLLPLYTLSYFLLTSIAYSSFEQSFSTRESTISTTSFKQMLFSLMSDEANLIE